MQSLITMADQYFTLAAKEETRSQSELKLKEILGYIYSCTTTINAYKFLQVVEGNHGAWLWLLNIAKKVSMDYYQSLKSFSPFKDKVLIFLDSGVSTLYQVSPDLIPLLQSRWFKKSSSVEEYFKECPGVVVINKPTVKYTEKL